ncbi:hypothetical protein IR012_05270 [Pseudomonas putida]|uniref:hypothetical protein n=1 Tax=Pseudomonas putida TaxID=303 RepID=UPI0018AA86A4|nr:hypothetical protein [Pseudomonas putida]MBF8668223.1 hypothetical protein [Pseudomonas putida]MBF8711723.1 hypothetical protein [Pseudomonas putida]
MVSYKSFYHPIDAAILWCNLTDHEAEILQVDCSNPSCLLKHFPQWPRLHLYAERIYDAIISGELPATFLGGPITLGNQVERAYWSIRHVDLRAWFALNYPHEKPAFLFDKAADHSECVSISAHLAVQLERDSALRELARMRETPPTTASQTDINAHINTGPSVPRGTNDALSEASTTILRVILGSVLTVTVGKSASGQVQSIYETQSALVDTILTQFPGISGLSKTTLDRKFAEARRLFAQALKG